MFYSYEKLMSRTKYGTSHSIKCMVAYKRLKTKESWFQIVSSESGCGCLREVVAYSKFQI